MARRSLAAGRTVLVEGGAVRATRGEPPMDASGLQVENECAILDRSKVRSAKSVVADLVGAADVPSELVLGRFAVNLDQHRPEQCQAINSL